MDAQEPVENVANILQDSPTPVLVAGVIVARARRPASDTSPAAVVYSIHHGGEIVKVTDKTGLVPEPMGANVLWPVQVRAFQGRSGGVMTSITRAFPNCDF